MLGSPDETAYDLRFRLLGIPVRVHPLFWLVMLLISGDLDNFQRSLVFVACAFVSILVHEFGHGLSGRLMGDEPSGIILYGMGGLCVFEYHRLTRWKRVFMIACGPLAGFVLFGLVVALLFSLGTPRSPVLAMAATDLIWINLIWGILNLFPLWPLDGGQITGTVLGMASPRNGMRWTHVISLLTAGLCAVLAWTFLHELFMTIWFGFFALVNFQVLQTLHTATRQRDDADWWRT
jgi:stage IV sporulation protein FB